MLEIALHVGYEMPAIDIGKRVPLAQTKKRKTISQLYKKSNDIEQKYNNEDA